MQVKSFLCMNVAFLVATVAAMILTICNKKTKFVECVNSIFLWLFY